MNSIQKPPAVPARPEPPERGPKAPEPVNPDPKAHPIHREIPLQPLHEGTDPKQPVHRNDTGV